jgi:hypothetical protein
MIEPSARHRLRFLRVVGSRRRSRWLLTMTGDAALPSGRTRFFSRPLVRRAFFMRGFPAFAGDSPLLVTIH